MVLSKTNFIIFFTITTLTYNLYCSQNPQYPITRFINRDDIRFIITEHCQYQQETQDNILETFTKEFKHYSKTFAVTIRISIKDKPVDGNPKLRYAVKRIVALDIK